VHTVNDIHVLDNFYWASDTAQRGRVLLSGPLANEIAKAHKVYQRCRERAWLLQWDLTQLSISARIDDRAQFLDCATTFKQRFSEEPAYPDERRRFVELCRRATQRNPSWEDTVMELPSLDGTI
jgi:hypothetical protein